MTEAHKCELLGGAFAIIVQLSLALVCVLTLVIKRQSEYPQRDWLVWFLDATKQGVGSSFGHFSNIYLSVVIAQSLPTADECQWYCTTYVLDATVGTACNLILLSLFSMAVRRFPYCGEGMIPGDYGDPPQLTLYLPQLAVWLMIVVFGKVLLLLSLSQVIVPLDALLATVFKPIRKYPELELVLVMILIPSVLNALQFWLTDSFLKRSESNDKLEDGAETEMTGLRSGHLDDDLLVSTHSGSTDSEDTSSSTHSGRMKRPHSESSLQSSISSVVVRISRSVLALLPKRTTKAVSSRDDSTIRPNRSTNDRSKGFQHTPTADHRRLLRQPTIPSDLEG